ncbi:MAG TPA: hypothetical protein VMZ28_09630 [Kofleriaceae bacterium]|nr:hypothetical protein [Kofleriaceae bacterium]
MSTRSARAAAALTFLALGLATSAGDAAAGRNARAAAAPSRESTGAAVKNWRQLGRVLRPRNTVTLARAHRFTSIDVGKLNAHRATLGQRPLRALILDVDETMAPHHGRISAANKEHIRALVAQGITVGIYSNARDDATPGRAEDFAELRTMGVYIAGEHVAAKPNRAGFDEVTRGLIAHAHAQGHTLAADEVAMVGDNYMTDGGAIQAGLAFVKVRPVKTDERPFRRPMGTLLKRSFQRATRAYASAAALAWDRVSGRTRPLQLDR